MAKFGDVPTTELVGAVKFGDYLTTDEMPAGGGPAGIAGWATTTTATPPLNTNLDVQWRMIPVSPPAVMDYLPATTIGTYAVLAIGKAGDASDLIMSIVLARPGSSNVVASRYMQQNGSGLNLFTIQTTTTIDDKFSVQFSKTTGTASNGQVCLAIWLVP